MQSSEQSYIDLVTSYILQNQTSWTNRSFTVFVAKMHLFLVNTFLSFLWNKGWILIPGVLS